MKRKTYPPTLENVLNLLSKRIDDFQGESKRSYQKAFSSFQLYLISNYPMSQILDTSVVTNWIIDNILHGLSKNTVGFYLDKISALYTKVGHKFDGGRTTLFKDIKSRLREFDTSSSLAKEIHECSTGITEIARNTKDDVKAPRILEKLIDFSHINKDERNEDMKHLWACLALSAGIPANVVRTIIGEVPEKLGILEISEVKPLSEKEIEETQNLVKEYIKGEPLHWFAMRLRPKVSYNDILERFSRISTEIRLPELFYPMEEIARMVGRKIIWKGKPVIRDVIFFKMRKSEIYHLFTNLYDLAWCYRTPGSDTGNYAVIPSKAMEDFKKAIGILSPDFEVVPAGEMKLNPGDEVVIVNGEYAREHAKILKESKDSEDGNKVFRVSLLNRNGRWDIGIDARLLKKV